MEGQDTGSFVGRGKLNAADLRARVRDAMAKRNERLPLARANRNPLVGFGLISVLGVLLAAVMAVVHGGWANIPFILQILFYALFTLAGVLGFILVFSLYIYPSKMAKQRFVVEERTFTLVDDGIHVEGASTEGLVKWNGIASVRCTDDHLYVYLSDDVAHVIPRHFFENDESFAGFYRELTERHEAAGGPAAELPSAKVVERSKPTD